jgi:hypothetical protein
MNARSIAARRSWRYRKAYAKKYNGKIRKYTARNLLRKRGMSAAERFGRQVGLKPGTIAAWIRIHDWKVHA